MYPFVIDDDIFSLFYCFQISKECLQIKHVAMPSTTWRHALPQMSAECMGGIAGHQASTGGRAPFCKNVSAIEAARCIVYTKSYSSWHILG